MDSLISGVKLTPLDIVPVEGGNVFHIIKRSSPGFLTFGEAYFSMILPNRIKAWKKHHRMTLNLIVPIGAVRFVIFDDRQNSASYGQMNEVSLSTKNYARLTIPPSLWLGFQCLEDTPGLILNVADIEHDPSEADRLPLDAFPFDWSKE